MAEKRNGLAEGELSFDGSNRREGEGSGRPKPFIVHNSRACMTHMSRIAMGAIQVNRILRRADRKEKERREGSHGGL